MIKGVSIKDFISFVFFQWICSNLDKLLNISDNISGTKKANHSFKIPNTNTIMDKKYVTYIEDDIKIIQ